jgi:arginase
MRTFSLIGVPIDSVGRSGGTEHSPQALRDLGLLGILGDGPDHGDLAIAIRGDDRDPDSGLIAHDSVISSTIAIRNATRDALARGERVFMAGGCCTELVGALAGARDAIGGASLAYFDGHLDLYDGDTSPTGEAADMPISVVLGDGPPAWVARVAPAPIAPPSAIAILGYHDPDELADVGHALERNRAAGLFDADAATIRRDGPAATSAAALAHVRLASDHVWLHIDLDVLDQAVFPATDYLMAGGLDWDELGALLAPVAAASELVGWSISCYNPEKDTDAADARAIVAAMGRLFAG